MSVFMVPELDADARYAFVLRLVLEMPAAAVRRLLDDPSTAPAVAEAAAAALDAAGGSSLVKLTALSHTVSVATLRRGFALDAEAMGPNLFLCYGDLVVKNLVNKKWNSVRATRGFDSGLHSWEVHVDRCVSKNIFVGVATVDAPLHNYIGSDEHGWGYLANTALWHKKTKVSQRHEGQCPMQATSERECS